MIEALQIVLALGPLPLLWLLTRSKGVLWRLTALPDATWASSWAAVGLDSRIDRVLVRSIIVFAYLCSTVSEAIDVVCERLRPLLLDPATHAKGRAEAIGFLRALVVRYPAIVFWALVVSLLDWVAGTLMTFTHSNGAALGHLTTPYVMALVAISMARFDGRTLTIDDDGGALGPFLVAVRMVLCGAVAAVVLGRGWSDGAGIAQILGTSGLVAATIGSAAPIRRWLRRDVYDGWRRHWLGRWTFLGAAMCAAATLIELLTNGSGSGGLYVAASLLGSLAYLGAASVIALLGVDPPGRPGFVIQGAGPGDDGPPPS